MYPLKNVSSSVMPCSQKQRRFTPLEARLSSPMPNGRRDVIENRTPEEVPDVSQEVVRRLRPHGVPRPLENALGKQKAVNPCVEFLHQLRCVRRRSRRSSLWVARDGHGCRRGESDDGYQGQRRRHPGVQGDRAAGSGRPLGHFSTRLFVGAGQGGGGARALLSAFGRDWDINLCRARRGCHHLRSEVSTR